MYCKLSEEQNLRKVSGWVYIFLATPVEVMMREMMQVILIIMNISLI